MRRSEELTLLLRFSEHEDWITRSRNLFRNRVRGSEICFWLRWLWFCCVLLAVLASPVGVYYYFGHIHYWPALALVQLVLFLHLTLKVYVPYMVERNPAWVPWPERHVGWIEPKYQYLL